MANRYEFKIEEIYNVMSISKDGDYSLMYARKPEENGEQSRLFVQTYQADPEYNGETVNAICPKCERWNTFNKAEYDAEGFQYHCEYCNDENEDIVTEEEIINIIQALLDEDTFFDIKLLINYEQIV